jgi:hypothetical protein
MHALHFPFSVRRTGVLSRLVLGGNHLVTFRSVRMMLIDIVRPISSRRSLNVTAWVVK